MPLKVNFVIWTVDKDGKRIPGAEPLLYKLRTPIEDFRVPAPGYPQGYWSDCQLDWTTMVMDQLTSQATPIGPMAALSDKYAKRKARKYGADQPILIASGDMFEGFFSGPDHVFRETAMGVTFGNQNPRAGYHFRGHETPTPLPRRPLGMTDEQFGPRRRSAAVRYCAAGYRQEGFRVAKEAGVNLTRTQATLVGKMVLGGGYGNLAPPAAGIGQPAMPI